MRIIPPTIADYNERALAAHTRRFEFLAAGLDAASVPLAADSDPGAAGLDALLDRLMAFQVAIPSWALGAGGTRFGRFGQTGEPRNLEEKIEDVGLLHTLNRSSGAISLHIPWDIPDDAARIRTLADSFGLVFDAMNSNTFQDPQYKYGSLQHVDKSVRKKAIEHNKEVIRYGQALGSKCLSVWLADGSNFPGQLNFREAFQNTLESLRDIYTNIPEDWKLLLEYKPFEPNFYSTTVADWGQSLLYISKLGPKAFTLVDLGHHLHGTNIEQIVALLLMEGRLGGFHFNDSKYSDDDLTVGSIKPYQLFLIFCELVQGTDHTPDISLMIDASHNVKDPLEDLLQSVEAIMIAYTQALLVDWNRLRLARESNDVVAAQETLQDAFRRDVRPLVAEARYRAGGALDPLAVYRGESVRKGLTTERGSGGRATGL
jgi:L-rhamnose isomerase/sugar isomerase